MAGNPPLPVLYSRALYTASKAMSLPTIDDETQVLVKSALSDLEQLNSTVATLALFSANETLEDISTTHLVYLSAPFILAEMQNRIKTTGSHERMINLSQTQRYLRTYVASLESFGVALETERALFAQRPSSIKDTAHRRDVKITQYKAEQTLRSGIETIRKRRRTRTADGRISNNFDLPSTHDDEEEESETDDALREASLMLLRLYYAQAYSQLESLTQELELLRSAPPPPPPESPVEERQKKAKKQEDMWKLDAVPSSAVGGPLLDSGGKPLRPFTILPAGSSNRARLQAQVYGPGHRLPTMSIDEYLEVERQRGNILYGGVPRSEAQPTSAERLAEDSEMDGTVFGEMKSEEKRQKDEQWAQFKEANPKGAGNTMNRG
ncbi:TAP42-like protein [Phlebopus sp. FC_14]|nr:TAP42-like protein [Phlebopus sp. FC_14]